MPKMNGIEVLEKLKSTPSTKAIPVIILSNLTEDTQLDEAMAKGATKYIKKVNSDPMQVADMIREIVQEKSQGKIPEKIPENKEEVNP
ncbi:response regulator [Patescibacteria group bacterium]|nr:response regulator [Patescibacteria group bacterium]